MEGDTFPYHRVQATLDVADDQKVTEHIRSWSYQNAYIGNPFDLEMHESLDYKYRV